MMKKELVWVFDMDGTLYTPVEHVWDETVKEMLKYFRDVLGLPVDLSQEEQDRLRDKWHTRQTTIAYLKEFNLDFDKVIKATHLPIIDSLRIESRLGADTIQNLPGRKIVLTNSPEAFAHALLKKINLHHCFDAILGLRHDLNYAKPNPLSYQRIVAGKRTIMIEDWDCNLVIPHKLGWTTVWFPEPNIPRPSGTRLHVDKEIQSLVELQDFI